MAWRMLRDFARRSEIGLARRFFMLISMTGQCHPWCATTARGTCTRLAGLIRPPSNTLRRSGDAGDAHAGVPNPHRRIGDFSEGRTDKRTWGQKLVVLPGNAEPPRRYRASCRLFGCVLRGILAIRDLALDERQSNIPLIDRRLPSVPAPSHTQSRVPASPASPAPPINC